MGHHRKFQMNWWWNIFTDGSDKKRWWIDVTAGSQYKLDVKMESIITAGSYNSSDRWILPHDLVVKIDQELYIKIITFFYVWWRQTIHKL